MPFRDQPGQYTLFDRGPSRARCHHLWHSSGYTLGLHTFSARLQRARQCDAVLPSRCPQWMFAQAAWGKVEAVNAYHINGLLPSDKRKQTRN